MPDLSQVFQPNDLGFIRIVASLWGVDLSSSDPAAAALELAEFLCDAELVEEVVSTLPKDGRAALEALTGAGGRIPWGTFTRRFGEVREMGPGKRDREQPHLHPASAIEVLWYRALVGRAFFDTEKGPQEFAFIPDDFLMVLDFGGADEPSAVAPVIAKEVSKETSKEASRKPAPVEEAIKNKDVLSALKPARSVAAPAPKPVAAVPVQAPPPPAPTTPAADDQALGRPASPAEKAFPMLATDRLLDDACTLLAALRMGIMPPETGIPVSVVSAFLTAAKILVNGVPQPEPVKNFLEASRAKGLEMLVGAWQNSSQFNELHMIPGLSCEGELTNQPLETREFLLNLLEPVPDKLWWSLPAFVRDVKGKYPDFQRPAGDYDLWFVKRESDGTFLRGFANWDNVDGALICYFISGPLFWLGIVDLAAPEEGAAPTSFRAAGPELRTPSLETGKLIVTSNGRITVPRLLARAARYQIARFCEWDAEADEEYRYRVTPASLTQARTQGLKPDHLAGVLRKYAAAPLPPPFVRALQRWETNGSEARIEKLVVLKVSKPEVLNELRASSASRFLGEILGPVTIVVKAGAQAKVLAALAEMGLLAEGEVDE